MRSLPALFFCSLLRAIGPIVKRKCDDVSDLLDESNDIRHFRRFTSSLTWEFSGC
jgi:hypothetical protein